MAGMKMDSKRKIWATFAAALIIVAVSGYTVGRYINAAQPSKQEPNLFVFMEKFSGRHVYALHNLITNIGEQELCTRAMTNQTATDYGFYWISVGNATASASLTQLTTQYERQKGAISAEWTYSGDYARNCSYKWTFGETVNLDCAGQHWASSGDNTMYAVANFPSGAQTFNLGENLTILWIDVFDCN
jgi:hypothetical protein